MYHKETAYIEQSVHNDDASERKFEEAQKRANKQNTWLVCYCTFTVRKSEKKNEKKKKRALPQKFINVAKNEHHDMNKVESVTIFFFHLYVALAVAVHALFRCTKKIPTRTILGQLNDTATNNEVI